MFLEISKKGGESEGNRWSLLLRSCEAGNQEGRKVRAPQGWVVRNADCSETLTAQGFGVRKVPQKKYRPVEWRPRYFTG